MTKAAAEGFLWKDTNSNRTEISYWLDSEFAGNGIMTQACSVFITHAFNDLQLNKVEIGVATNNIKSRAIPERLGFTQEGTIRNYELLHNQYRDRVM
ncbi:GNAT family N-acetyltransferase [Paenibacillus sp. JDR-2]|uniref:GNAT family N-acetyltransferase n=1 Tax=Paenibacillus sp. (strain JDR-2) TaxID=324057 RepID=UPI003A0FBB99